MKNEKRGVLQLFGIATLVLCTLFVLFGVPFFWAQVRVLRNWPVAQAQVLRSEVVTQPAPGHEQLYAAKVQVLYTVDDKPIVVELTTIESKSYLEAETRAAQFPVGSRHAIRYDPHDPAQARIGAGWNRRFFAVPLVLFGMGGAFGMMAVGCFVWAGRA
jgi:hypothetical protein